MLKAPNNTSLPAASENWVWAEDSALGPCQGLFQGLLLPGTHHPCHQPLTPDLAWWSLFPVDTSAPQLPGVILACSHSLSCWPQFKAPPLR